MKVSVIGNGRWGSFLAWYAARTGHDVTLYGRPGSPRTAQFEETRKNDLLALPENVTLTSDFARALAGEVVLVSIPSQNLRQLLAQVAEARPAGRPLYVLCMKGLEIATGERLSQVAKEMLGEDSRVAVWLGPGHVQEFVRGAPNCMVVDSEDEAEKRFLIGAFGSDLIRFYYGEDLIGNEVGAAAKNVVGIAAGMLDGFGLTSLKGALMSRGTREYARLIKAMGGNELSAYGLCHLGDYEATVFSPHSNNRMFGERFIQGKSYEKLAEGYYTVQAMVGLSEKMGVELPISRALYQVLYQQGEPQKVLDGLFSRSLKQEFY
ncbi:NAD(P)H-dependent glycerol-3-phosphate dehydrogenase [Ruminococcaceae bacterium OttesenSCG-928-O06]|nr:NAD(P)H-dependent glycerol-3-phosphate dehydrogenase [Ruminococcaceae bacterium OttesenSCG-928-O06]